MATRIDGKPRDTQTQYMRNVLGFLGTSCVEFVYAEGLAMARAIRDHSLAQAHEHIERLASPAVDTAQRIPRSKT
jgi:FMN-dependent NADH-azoreductase